MRSRGVRPNLYSMLGLTNSIGIVNNSGRKCCRKLLLCNRRRCRYKECCRCIRWSDHPHQQCWYPERQRVSGLFPKFSRCYFFERIGLLSFKNMTDAELDAIVAVHLKGAFACTKAAWPIFRKQKFGRIINTASAAGLYGVFVVISFQ